MATATVKVINNPTAIRAVLSGPGGEVAQDLRRRGNRVLNKARALVPVDTGALRASLKMELVMISGVPTVRIGSALPYAVYVHEGTGIYVGRPPIRPRTGQFLRWPRINNKYPVTGGPRRYKAGATQAYVYARQVRGMKGTPYLLKALDAAAD